jgi:hypothetical protein
LPDKCIASVQGQSDRAHSRHQATDRFPPITTKHGDKRDRPIADGRYAQTSFGSILKSGHSSTPFSQRDINLSGDGASGAYTSTARPMTKGLTRECQTLLDLVTS